VGVPSAATGRGRCDGWNHRRFCELPRSKFCGVKLDDINDNLEALGRGDVVGRAVIVFD
jgi:hypothetical protein